MSGKDQSVISKEALMSTKPGKQIMKQALFKSKGYKLFNKYKEETENQFPDFAERFAKGLLAEIKSDTNPNSTQQSFGDEVGSTEIILNASEIEPIKSKLESLEVMQDRVNRILNSNFVKMTFPVFNGLFDAAAEYSGRDDPQLKQDIVDYLHWKEKVGEDTSPEAPFFYSSNAKGVTDTIYKRHSVRDYSDELVSEASIHALLYAAVQAPTSMHQEPWAFAIIQDKKVLERLSEHAKEMVFEEQRPITTIFRKILNKAQNADFNIFYNSSTLMVIYGKPLGEFVAADCWLAAQNVMLAAYGANLGSCVIGFAVPALNTAQWKKKLEIPLEMTAYAPIIVGNLAGETPGTSRKPPEVLCWLKTH